MNSNVRYRIIQYFKKRYRFWTVILAAFLIVSSYLIILNIEHNHLSFTHLMYVPVVLIGTTFGGLYGFITGIIAGLLVGPFLPYNLETGESQYYLDWGFRMMMISFIGLMSGLVSGNIRKVRESLNQQKLIDANSGLNNLNYLRGISLINNQSYMVATLLIGNAETITDVNGYEAYYTYLQNIKDQLLIEYPKIIIALANINQLWILLEQKDYDDFINHVLKVVQTAHHVPNHDLFVDYALGFSTHKHFKDSDITKHFINSDLAARQAKSKYLTYLKYDDIVTNKQFEYELLSEFMSALDDGQIYMVYQPIIDLKSGKPKAIEALIRWEHPEKRMIRPDQFIPAVEKTNMIHVMTLRVFEWALKYATDLKQKGIDIQVSINISTKNLYDLKFFEHMIEVFQKFEIKPSNVELEITETVLMEDPEISKRILEKFTTFGFRIAIDDFGKGYSSLAYLAQFPINVIKVDRIFTSQILINPATQTIVKATIDLAKQLGYEVLIEGIEDKETADLLTKMGCHSAQGYFYMRPRKDTDILEYLLKQK